MMTDIGTFGLSEVTNDAIPKKKKECLLPGGGKHSLLLYLYE